MEGYCWPGQSTQWAVVPMEEKEYTEPLLCLLFCMSVNLGHSHMEGETQAECVREQGAGKYI